MQSILGLRTGRPTTGVQHDLPVPPTLNNSDRDYFRAQVEGGGTFIGDMSRRGSGRYAFRRKWPPVRD